MNNEIDSHNNIIMHVNITSDPMIHSNYAQLHYYTPHTCDLEAYQKFNYWDQYSGQYMT